MAVILAMLIGISCLVLALQQSFSEEPTRNLSVEPSQIVYDSLTVGKRFSINISVTNVTSLTEVKFRLSYNTVMLDALAFSFLAEDHLPSGYCNINDLSGTISMNITYEGQPITTVNPVALASIKFKMMDYGESPLHLYNTSLRDSGGNLLAHQTRDGVVLIRLHDVAIVKIEASTTQTYPGHNVTITVVATNYGHTKENFTVTVYHNQTKVGSFQVVNLSAGQNMTLTFQWNTTDAVAGQKYVLKAEASTVPYEAKTSNNLLLDGQVHVKIVGDINGDNNVDINDLIAWDLAYGSSQGQTNWNPQADINGNGVVDKEDGTLIIQNYRKHV